MKLGKIKPLPKGAYSSSKEYMFQKFDGLYEIDKLSEEGVCRDNLTNFHENVVANKNGEARGLSWYGVGSLPTYLEAVREGHPDTMKTILQLQREIEAEVGRSYVQKRKRSRGDIGEELDIHSVYNGNLSRAWTKTQRQERPGSRKIVINLDCGAHFGRSAREMFWGPAAALVLSTLFVKARYMVELNAHTFVKRPMVGIKKYDVYMQINLKKFSHPLNIPQLSIACLGGMFRYHGFKILLFRPEPYRPGLGYMSDEKDLLLVANEEKPRHLKNMTVICVPRLDNKENAVDFIETITSKHFQQRRYK